jgi:hypothetical protein
VKARPGPAPGFCVYTTLSFAWKAAGVLQCYSVFYFDCAVPLSHTDLGGSTRSMVAQLLQRSLQTRRLAESALEGRLPEVQLRPRADSSMVAGKGGGNDGRSHDAWILGRGSECR